MTHWHPDARLFGPAGRAFKSTRGPFWKQGWICVAMTVRPPKGRLRLYAWTVRGSLYSSPMSPHGGGLIGGPCFVRGAHKDIGVRSRRGLGVEGKQQHGWREEQVSHRIVCWDELKGGLATGLQGDTTHSFTHTHSHTHIHTLSGGFWCQLLASSSTNDPRLTHIVSHVWGFPLSHSPVETLSYGCSVVLPAFSAGTALGPHVGWHCSPRPKDNEAVGWAERVSKGEAEEEGERKRETGRKRLRWTEWIIEREEEWLMER